MRGAVAAVALGLLLGQMQADAARSPTCLGRAATIVGGDNGETIRGTSGGDVIVAADGADQILGRGGSDRICGGGGTDEIRGGPGRDSIHAGDGDDVAAGGGDDDVVRGGEGFDNVDGSTGSDHLLGGAGDDAVGGGDGDDEVIGGSGSDLTSGGPGNDELHGGDNPPVPIEALEGGAGDDLIDGGPGLDRALFFDSPGSVDVDLGAGRSTGDGTDTLNAVEGAIGSEFDDTIVGDEGSNGLSGGGGNDTLRGLGSGTFESGESDFLVGGDGDDELFGGRGHDFVSYDAGCFSGVVLDLTAGMATGQGEDALSGVEGAFGSDCDDTFVGNGRANAFVPLAGDDVIDGVSGHDTTIFFFSRSAVAANLATGAVRGPATGEDRLKNVDELWGTVFDDLLVGNGRANTLLGSSGDDALYGAGGDDLLDGQGDTDRVDGGNGSDACTGEITNGCEAGDTGSAHAAPSFAPWRDASRR